MTGDEQTSVFPTTLAGRVALIIATLPLFLDVAFCAQAAAAPRFDDRALFAFAFTTPSALAVIALITAATVRFLLGSEQARLSLPISAFAVGMIPVYMSLYFGIVFSQRSPGGLR
jgi:hypothetical protein